MKKTIFFNLFLWVFLIPQVSFGQTVVYSENFDGPTTWTLNTDMIGEGMLPNQWYISCEEEGVGTGNCGAACGAGNNTLHLSTNIGLLGDLGAAYAETGGAFTTTNRRAHSANISTVGFTNLTLSFDMIGFGGNANDYTELFYSTNGGVTWTSLASPLTAACCGGPCTGTQQGLWQTNSYPLPAACEGIANLRISFVWRNLDDGIATDPSFAVDNIEITTPGVATPALTAGFNISTTPICVGETITFTDNSSATATTITGWAWIFTTGAPGTANTQGPHVVTFNTVGTHDIILEITDGTITESITQQITVSASLNAGANGSSNLCNNTTLNLNTLLSGADPGGTWTETSGTPSGQFTAGTGVLNGTGLPVGNIYTFNYQVGSGACGDDADFTITIIDCAPGATPTANFTASNTNICAGDCITFTDLSTPGDITTWGWDFGGGATPNNFVGQNPGSVCFNTPGTYTVTLGVMNPFGNDSYSVDITVNAPPTVTANAAPSTTLCSGDPLTLTGGGASTYVWTGGATNGNPFTPPAGNTTYTVTGTDANGCQNTANVSVNVVNCVPLQAGFSFRNNICSGDCITFTDTSSGNVVAWTWDFGSGAIPITSNEQNPVVCFNVAGNYNIQLTVTDALGDNSSTTHTITVYNSPIVVAELDTIIELGGIAQLEAIGSGGGTYLWTPDYYLYCDTCAISSAKPQEDTDYIVIYTDSFGCTAQDTVKVLVNFIKGIGVPSAFSPNGDGMNDLLVVKGLGITSMNFRVYNRYGQMVFETDNQSNGWDGNFRGQPENPGVFVWTLEYQFINGTGGSLSGNTTLIR